MSFFRQTRYAFSDMRVTVAVLCILLGAGGVYFFLRERPPGVTPLIDVIIPCVDKDVETLELCIQGIRENGKGVRRIIVVSPIRFTENAEWYSESDFPFTKKDIATTISGTEELAEKYLLQPGNRIGWIYQQLLKLYAPFVIPGLTKSIFVLDADTIFLNPTDLFDRQGIPFYNISKENHPAYFAHAKKLIPSLERAHKVYTGIAHCMVFQKEVLEEIFQEVEEFHKCAFWKVFCGCIDRTCLDTQSASEYQLYFHYAFTHNPDLKLRSFKWCNVFRLDNLQEFKEARYNYVSCHSYLRDLYRENPEKCKDPRKWKRRWDRIQKKFSKKSEINS